MAKRYMFKTFKYSPVPKIDKIIHFAITPERFVQACDPVEFEELQIEVERRLRRELTSKDIEDFKAKLKSNQLNK